MLEALKSLDDVAFVRYASVYRDFSHAEDFEKVIAEISAKIARDPGPDAIAARAAEMQCERCWTG